MKRIVLGIILILIIPLNVCAEAFIKGEKIQVVLSECIDGDTSKFETSEGIKTTRFLAIDTPESTTKTEEYGKEASNFTCEKLKKAKIISLEFDKSSNLYDKYNRLLAWVWVDDVLLQDEIIKAGLGEVAYLYGKYTYTSLLQDHQAVAEANKLKIWSINETKDNFISDNNLELLIISIIVLPYLLIKKPKYIKSIMRKLFKQIRIK